MAESPRCWKSSQAPEWHIELCWAALFRLSSSLRGEYTRKPCICPDTSFQTDSSRANFFFYYGTTVFTSVGLENSYVTQITLGTYGQYSARFFADTEKGAVNVATTFPGLYMVEKFGRRKCLMSGAAWMFMCFLVFASCGQFALKNADGSNNQSIGYVMIIFSCLFIAAFASTCKCPPCLRILNSYPSYCFCSVKMVQAN